MADQSAGLRGIVGAGGSRVSVSAAMRVRDRGRPDAAEIEAAEQEIDRRLAGGRSTSAPHPTRRAAVPAADRTPAPTAKPSPRGAPTPADVGARPTRDTDPVAGATPPDGPGGPAGQLGPGSTPLPPPHPGMPGRRRDHGRGGSSPSAS